MQTVTWTERIREIAVDAGKAIMSIHDRSDIDAPTKADGSPVSCADAAAEALILRALTAIAPDVPVVSEENAASHALTAPERFFLVDPLDGTKEFLRKDGNGAFTVNIALIKDGRPVAGVVHAPALGRTFVGLEGRGASEAAPEQQRSISVRPVPDYGPVAVASASHRDKRTDQWLTAHGIADTVSIGSSLKFCLVACGEADVYPRFGRTMEWDTAAGDAVLRAAGGQVTTADSEPFAYGKTGYENGSFIAWGQRDSVASGGAGRT